MPTEFDNLRDQLLRGGVAPRHVTRYLRELKEHIDDLIAEEEHRGVDRAIAERSALARLGDTDTLAKTVMARKEFFSWSYRAPWAIFFLAPVAALVAINLISILLLVLIPTIAGTGSIDLPPTLVPGWFNWAYMAMAGFDLFVSPLLLGWTITFLAVRLKMNMLWPIVGLSVVSLFCGLQTFDIQWSSVPNGVNGIGVSWPFVPHGSRITVATGCRALLNFGLTLALYSWWRSRRSHRTTGFRQRV